MVEAAFCSRCRSGVRYGHGRSERDSAEYKQISFPFGPQARNRLTQTKNPAANRSCRENNFLSAIGIHKRRCHALQRLPERQPLKVGLSREAVAYFSPGINDLRPEPREMRLTVVYPDNAIRFFDIPKSRVREKSALVSITPPAPQPRKGAPPGLGSAKSVFYHSNPRSC